MPLYKSYEHALDVDVTKFLSLWLRGRALDSVGATIVMSTTMTMETQELILVRCWRSLALDQRKNFSSLVYMGYYYTGLTLLTRLRSRSLADQMGDTETT